MAISSSIKLLSRCFSSLSSNPLRICVVGSGPAGFYTAEKLLKKHEEAEVDLIDRLPTPFGLVRSGVAPDHPETKIVTNQFSRVLRSGCVYFGNVSLGSSISLDELRDLYDVVVLAYGAESDRFLGIPGEDLKGIYSAREFVWWYNGHPEYSNLSPDLQGTDTAIVLGQGNVALDVARILLRSTEELAVTDIASHSIAALKKSCIRKVYLVGRRGPVQAACTAKELREILGLRNLRVHIDEADLTKTAADEEEMRNNRIRRRVYELLSKASLSGHSAQDYNQRDLHFLFFRKPDRFVSTDDTEEHVAGMTFEKTILKEDVQSGKQIAVGTGEFERIESRMVLKSIGYKSVPVNGLPFDHHKGIVPNIRGRVLCEGCGDELQIEKGLYVCGWLKRGPTGIIATNLYCAEETVSSISEDIDGGVLSIGKKNGREGLKQIVESKKDGNIVSFEGWEKIDTEERRRGLSKNKPRDKLTTWDDLLDIAASG